MEFILQINYKINMSLIICLQLFLMTLRKLPGYIPGLIGIGILLMLVLPSLALPAAGQEVSNPSGKEIPPQIFWDDFNNKIPYEYTIHLSDNSGSTGYEWVLKQDKDLKITDLGCAKNGPTQSGRSCLHIWKFKASNVDGIRQIVAYLDRNGSRDLKTLTLLVHYKDLN
jgi:predicted secreted protein